MLCKGRGVGAGRLRWLTFANNGNSPSEGSDKVELSLRSAAWEDGRMEGVVSKGGGWALEVGSPHSYQAQLVKSSTRLSAWPLAGRPVGGCMFATWPMRMKTY